MRFGIFSERDMLNIYGGETDCKMTCEFMLDYESIRHFGSCLCRWVITTANDFLLSVLQDIFIAIVGLSIILLRKRKKAKPPLSDFLRPWFKHGQNESFNHERRVSIPPLVWHDEWWKTTSTLRTSAVMTKPNIRQIGPNQRILLQVVEACNWSSSRGELTISAAFNAKCDPPKDIVVLVYRFYSLRHNPNAWPPEIHTQWIFLRFASCGIKQRKETDGMRLFHSLTSSISWMQNPFVW